MGSSIVRTASRAVPVASVCAVAVMGGPASFAQPAKLSPPPGLGAAYGVSYGTPFIDVDEMRALPRPHRYIHGGFEDSHLRFSIYLPPKALYKERFLLMLEGGQGGLDKMMAGASSSWKWAYDVAFDDLGAYLVETNEGHWPDEGLGVDSPRDLWQASAYATRYAMEVAKAVYGAAPSHGYMNGCSGGAVRASRHLENAPDLFAGSVSQSWSNAPTASAWSIYALAGALLGDKFPQVIDAFRDGGSRDPYVGLDERQKDALRTLLTMGFPRQGISQLQTGWFAVPFVMYGLYDDDPSYYTDFWTKPGYMGHDHPEDLKPLLVDTTVTVDKTLTVADLLAAGLTRSNPDVATYGSDSGAVLKAKQGAIVGYPGDLQRLFMGKITILSGPDAGKSMLISSTRDGVVQPFVARASYAFDNVKPGDKVRIDNRDFVAYMYYHRHAAEVSYRQMGVKDGMAARAFPQYRLFLDGKGQTLYPQRSVSVAPPQKATYQGKQIVFVGGGDEPIWPVNMEHYVRQARATMGQAATDHLRFYMVEHVPHCSGAMEGPRSVEYVPNVGMNQEMLRDLVRWTEQGVQPPGETAYRFSEDNELLFAPAAAERKGVQPVVRLTSGGKTRVEVVAGAPVTLDAVAEAPPGAFKIVKADFDFDGKGTWPTSQAVASGAASQFSAQITHTYDKPGTYFVTFRAGSLADGAKGEPVYNLTRVRVIVR
jgi:hypothetical protein